MITLAPEFGLALVIALISAVGSFFAVKQAGAETQRLVKALHSRFDRVEKRVTEVELVQARQDERLKSLKSSQRFRVRALVEPTSGEVPLFADEGEEG